LLLVLVLAVIEHAVSAPDGEKYTTRYDNFDVESVLRSERLLRNYFNCLMDKGPCTREGLELKKDIPDALLTECIKCSEIQKKNAGHVMAFIQLYHPDMWEAILNKYDPEGTFRKKYGVDDDEEEEGER